MSLNRAYEVNTKEKRALVEEGGLECVMPYVAVRDLETVALTPSPLRRSHPCVWRPLPGVHLQRARVQHCPTLDYRFLWCHVDNSSYRRHYLRFLEHEYGWSTPIPSGWHVDHVFNRARAKKLELEWVRMMLLPGSINSSHGAGYEKQRTKSPVSGTPQRSRKLDDVTLLKVVGMRSPRRHAPLDQSIETYSQWIAGRHGLSAEAVKTNIRELLAI